MSEQPHQTAPEDTHPFGVQGWPGVWRAERPSLADHKEGRGRLAWLVKGEPFNRPVLAQTSLGVRRDKTKGDAYGTFVVTQIHSDGLHGVLLYPENPLLDNQKLRWLGPIPMDNPKFTATTQQPPPGTETQSL